MTLNPPDSCFICESRLTRATATREHVYPQWLRRAVEHRNPKPFRLLNGTRIAHSQLTVPCCRPCNNELLAPVEEAVAVAMLNGPGAIRGLDPVILTVWAAKVLWGLLVRESTLRSELADPDSVAIVSPEHLRDVAHLRDALQAFRDSRPVDAGTVLAYPSQIASDPTDNGDYVDSVFPPMVATRVQGTATIICIDDAGAIGRASRGELINLGYLPVFTDLDSLAVNPLQFRELFAWTRVARVSMHASGSLGPYDAAHHLEHLAGVWEPFGYTPPTMVRPDGRPRSLVFNDDLTPRFVSVEITRLAGNLVDRFPELKQVLD